MKAEKREGTDFKKDDKVVCLFDLEAEDDGVKIKKGSIGMVTNPSSADNNTCTVRFGKHDVIFTHYMEYDNLNLAKGGD